MRSNTQTNSMLVHLNAHRDFEAHLDPTGIALILERPGADDVHKSIHMHINFAALTYCESWHSTLACSLTYCESWPQRLAAFRRMTSCIAINSRMQSLSYTPR